MTIQPTSNPFLKLSMTITNSCICCDKDDVIQQVEVKEGQPEKKDDKDTKPCCHCNLV